jgi:hypothetical protein
LGAHVNVTGKPVECYSIDSRGIFAYGRVRVDVLKTIRVLPGITVFLGEFICRMSVVLNGTAGRRLNANPNNESADTIRELS